MSVPNQKRESIDELEADWSTLRRATPASSAPNVPSLPVRLVLSIFIYVALIATLLVVLPACLIRYITIGPPLKWQPLSTYLEGRLVYWSGRLSDAAFLRPAPPGGKVPSNLPLKWAKEGRADVECEVVELEAVGEDMRRGVGRIEGVQPQKRWGYMLTPPGSAGRGTDRAKADEKVVIYFHGGSYASGHPVQFPFPWQTAKAVDCRLLGVQYRLCLSTSTSFPAPILDALSGYFYLTRQLGFDPRNVVLMGDSSGGHLALCLSRYTAELGLPHPGFIALTSPLGDCGRSLPTRQSLKGIDILASNMDAKPLRSALRHYTPDAVKHPYFAPARAGPDAWSYLANTCAKVYIMVGTKEVLRDDGLGIVNGMKEAGVDVTLREDEGGNHCGPMAQWKGSSAWNLWSSDLRQLVR